MPTGSKPASRTSTNSFTDRSLVNSLRSRISARRSRAWTGRSFGNSGIVGRLVCLEGHLLGLLGGDLDVVGIVLGIDQRIAPPAERDHRENQRRHRVRAL